MTKFPFHLKDTLSIKDTLQSIVLAADHTNHCASIFIPYLQSTTETLQEILRRISAQFVTK